MNILYWSRYWISLAVLLLPLQSIAETFTVGVVPQFEASKVFKIWKPVLAELTKRTGYQFKLMPSRNIPQFEKEFARGKFDIVYLNPYHMLLANKAQGYVPIVRDHGRALRGILVAKKNSGIKSIEDLQGKQVVFPAPNALGASLLMRAELAKQYHVNIRPKYVKTHNSVYLNVQSGLASAGGGVGRTYNAQPDKIKGELTVIHKTRKVSPHPVAVHPRIGGKARETLQRAFLDLGVQGQTAALLKGIPMKKIGVSSMADYTVLESLGLNEFYVK